MQKPQSHITTFLLEWIQLKKMKEKEKKRYTKFRGECGKTIIHTLLVVCILIYSLWKTLWKWLIKLNICNAYYPAIPPLGTYPIDIHSHLPEDMHRNVQVFVMFTICKKKHTKKLETKQMIINSWVKKITYSVTSEPL